VVVTDGNAYLFADGILKCAYLNIEIKNFYYGAENMSGVFTETKICEYGSAGTSAFADAIKEYEAINSTATSEFTDIDQSVSYMASFNTVNGTDNFDLSRGIGKTENFMFETSITINSYSNNAHLTFNFNDNPNTRFLIHEEENGSNVFKYRISYVSGTGSVTLSSDTPTTLKVAILVTDGNAYMFVNGTLYCAYLNIGKISTFEVGSELLSANFNSNLIYTNGSSVYADYLAKVTSYENTANNNSATQKIVI
ncbi:MAG: hypothetical protein J6V68_03780, partial [Clostridia bacterium]|nr:hypothetical protein [Clostridia bacterium]